MSELLEKHVATATADVTVPTTTETAAIVSGPVQVPSATCLVHIRGWCQLVTGAAASAVTVRIERGSAAGGTLVGEGNSITLGAAAGSREVMSIEATERRANEESVSYVMTVQQTGATGDGTVSQAAIEVEILSG